MRALLGLIALVPLLVACEPEIGGGTYYCGPDQLCPPHLTCDGPTFTCESPIIAKDFACPTGSQEAEPDEALADARDLGSAVCGTPVVDGARGCIAGGTDQADTYVFESPVTCSGANPRFRVQVRFPVATAPLELEVLDADGALIATGSPCASGATGLSALCIALDPSIATYYVRVRLATDIGGDCDGTCAYNQYWLDILYPLA